jgi:hypothetical protein
MPRFFTLAQAEQALPEVESAIRDAIALKSAYQTAEQAWQAFSRRVTMLGGVRVDHSRLAEQIGNRESIARQLKDAIDKIQDQGCLIKDLDIGLLDFPTLLHGEEVYLCWKLGERGIGFWHGIQEGFRGRKQIDREFLDHHRGDPSN